MKRLLVVVLLAFGSLGLISLSGCGGETAQEKEWKKDIPTVPAGDTSKPRAPAGGAKP